MSLFYTCILKKKKDSQTVLKKCFFSNNIFREGEIYATKRSTRRSIPPDCNLQVIISPSMKAIWNSTWYRMPCFDIVCNGRRRAALEVSFENPTPRRCMRGFLSQTPSVQRVVAKPFQTIGIWIITEHTLRYLRVPTLSDRYPPVNHTNMLPPSLCGFCHAQKRHATYETPVHCPLPRRVVFLQRFALRRTCVLSREL